MALFFTLLLLHILGACVWVGGHLTVAVAILPRALRMRRAAPVADFERNYERIGLPALGVQIITGFWLAWLRFGPPAHWFGASPVQLMLQLKLLCLLGTLVLAVHAKTRVIPRLRDDNLPVLGAHIVGVTTFAVLFVVAGASLHSGGYPF